MENQRLYIAMVGLPARGKSTIATKLKESLVHESVKARIFNNGDLRRKTIRENTSYAGFFDSNNSEGVAIREQIALTNMERAQKVYQQCRKRCNSGCIKYQPGQKGEDPVQAK